MSNSLDHKLPAFLTRPEKRQPVARLSYSPAVADKPDSVPRWRVTGSPEVGSLCFRLFSNFGLSGTNTKLSFPVVPQNFQDLLMLQHRFPIEIEAKAREVWETLYAQTVDAWFIRNGIDEATQSIGGDLFKGKLKPFQVEGVRFMLAGYRTLLADDMGLGKTPQALALLAHLDRWPVAILVQPHVIPHWRRKLGEFVHIREVGTAGEGLTWQHLHGKPSRDTPKADVYLLHYLVAHAWEGWLRARGVKTVICDEVQELRHTGTKKHDACKAILRSAERVEGLSGTPIYNRGPEIYNVMNAIAPGCLGTFEAFKREWCDWEDRKLVVKDPGALGQYLRDRKLMLRRTKDEVMSELPEKRRVIEPLTADNALFAELVMEAGRLARQASSVRDPFDRARMEAEAIAQTRLATGVAKGPAAVAFLRGLMEGEEPTLVFAHHHAVYDEILSGLADFNPVAITGRETLAVKDRSQQAFMKGETNLCLISLRAATGLDGLQERARVVVFVELDWSPAIHRQAEDRAHRHGQQDSVLCYYLVTDVGTDPAIRQVLAVKETQFSGLMHDPELAEEDLRAAERAAEEHKASILTMLRKHY